MSVEVKSNTDQERRESLRVIYNDAVKLLELLNVLIPQIDTFKPKLQDSLIQEVSDKCFELGANIATNTNSLTGKEDEDDEEERWGFPFGL